MVTSRDLNRRMTAADPTATGNVKRFPMAARGGRGEGGATDQDIAAVAAAVASGFQWGYAALGAAAAAGVLLVLIGSSLLLLRHKLRAPGPTMKTERSNDEHHSSH